MKYELPNVSDWEDFRLCGAALHKQHTTRVSSLWGSRSIASCLLMSVLSHVPVGHQGRLLPQHWWAHQHLSRSADTGTYMYVRDCMIQMCVKSLFEFYCRWKKWFSQGHPERWGQNTNYCLVSPDHHRPIFSPVYKVPLLSLIATSSSTCWKCSHAKACLAGYPRSQGL